jgi:MFS family permease
MGPVRSNAKSTDPSIRWIYSVLPINIALGPVGTFVQLYILELHGTVIDIGLATTLFNAVSIPAAMIWGFATDRMHRRRMIIVGSYLVVAITLALFLFAESIYGVELLYAIFSLVSSAAATPLNLLIMETQHKSKWAPTFARFSMFTGIGATLGVLIGVAWADFLPFHLLVIPLAALSVLSAVLSQVMIREPSFVFERTVIVMVKRSFYERLLVIPMFFLKIPRLMDFKRVFKWLRYELTRDPTIIYLFTFTFYLASGIFNTSLVPSLSRASVSKSQVFLVSLIGMAVQTMSFNYLVRRIGKRSLRETTAGGLLLRGSCYAAIGVSVFFLTGLWYLGATLFFYPLAAGIAYAAYYAASNVMVFNTLGRANQGSTLGVYSALVGFATMLGSFISGFVSFYFGYYVTFFLAAFCLAVGAFFTSTLSAGVEGEITSS